MCFLRTYRLTTKAAFKNVFDHASKIDQKKLLLLFKANQKNYSRLGLIVGKRKTNNAVIRNQIKRVMRESFRLNLHLLKGLDLIVIARGQCDTLNKLELRKNIDKLWEILQVNVTTSCQNGLF